MPRITLYDAEKMYIINVTNEEAKRAQEDLQFVTYLLNKYVNPQATINLFPESNPDLIDNISTADTASAEHMPPVQDMDIATNTTPEFLQDDSQEKDSFRWPHEAILLLLRLYADNEHHLTSGKTTHKKFWELLSSQLVTNGYDVNGLQCKSKMAGLKNTYKNIIDHNAKSGNCRRTWKYFDVMNEMFTKKPWVKPLLTLESGSSNITSSEEDIQNITCDTETLTLPCEKKSKRKRYNSLEKMIESNAIARQRMHEEAMSRQDKLLDILTKFLQQ